MIVRGNPIRRVHSPIAAVAALWLFLCLAIAAAPCCRAACPADAILGTWVVAEKDAHIEIYKQDDGYFGKISWLREDDEGKPKSNAPPPRMHETPRKGLVIVRGFRFDGTQWKGGTLYDPTDGKSYRGVIRLDEKDRLHVRGFIAIPLFGRTTIWQRVPYEP